jgi:hypothetical protein
MWPVSPWLVDGNGSLGGVLFGMLDSAGLPEKGSIRHKPEKPLLQKSLHSSCMLNG